MQEVSNETRAVEVHEKAKAYYQASEQFGYKFYMEIKTIRDEKLFRSLNCSSFSEYTEKYFGYNSDTVNLRIQDATNWKEDYTEALRSYGKHKARQLGLIPTKERKNAIENGIPTSEGVKTVDEATTREIETYKKQVKEQENQLKAKNEQIELQSKMIDDLNEKEPQVIEREVTIEKIPDDYNELKRQANSIVNIEEENRSLKKEKERLEQESRKVKEELQAKRKIESDELQQAQLARLQRNADINVHKLILDMNEFVKSQSITVYDSEAIAGATNETKEKLTQSIKRVESLLKDIKQEIGGEVTWIIN